MRQSHTVFNSLDGITGLFGFLTKSMLQAGIFQKFNAGDVYFLIGPMPNMTMHI